MFVGLVFLFVKGFPGMELALRVNRIMREEHLSDPEDSIVVAVSGGPDSIALLHILFLLAEQWKWRLIVAHVNHQFRGEESDQEADFVSEYAIKLGLPCEIGLINVPQYIKESRLNGQAAAREKRYDFLLATADKYQAQRIALAHHADDQAETILMRLLRGTGASGLSGIPLRRRLKNVELIRPLLRIYKSEVLHHCEKFGLSFCNDSSNAQHKYVRNQIRHELIPLLKRYNPQLPESLNRLADVISFEDDFLKQEVDAIFHKIVGVAGEGLQLPRAEFIKLHSALQRRLIKLLLEYLAPNTDSFDFLTAENVRNAIMQETPTTLTLMLGANIVFAREYEQVFFRLNPTLSTDFHFSIDTWNGQLALPGGGQLRYYTMDRDIFNASGLLPGKDAAVFDAAALSWPLIVRSRQNGDRIEINGLNGSKKVKDIFIDAKLPLRMRNSVPLLIDAAERILWIPGFRRSIHAIATPTSSRLLCIELHRPK
jgi:tRNA(Ile)-lysidine synthase